MTPTPPRHLALAHAATQVTLLGLGAGAAAILVDGRVFRWLLWSDRDLARAASLAEGAWVTTGAELSFGSGGRIPGGAQAYLLAPAVLGSGDPLVVWRWVALWVVLGVALLWPTVRRHGGPLAASVAVGAWAVSDVVCDAIWVLWNPTLLVPFVGLAWWQFVRLVGDRAPDALPWWALGLALATQMHLSVVVLALPMAVAVAAARPQVRTRHLALAAIAVVGAYAPHLADELLHGFPNTRLLIEQGPIPKSAGPGSPVGNLTSALRALAGVSGLAHSPVAADHGPLATAWVVARWLPVFAAIGLAWREPDAARRRVLLGAGLVLATSVAWFGGRAAYQLHNTLSRRFLIAALPGFALLAGAGTTALVDRVATRRPALATATLASCAVVALAQGQVLAERWRIARDSWNAWPRHERLLAEVQDVTGWTLPEMAGRAVLAGSGRGFGGQWLAVDGVDYLLARQGRAFPGSLAPPCAVVYAFRPLDVAGRPTVDDLAVLLGRDASELTLLDVLQTPSDHVVVRYDTTEGLCPTSMVDRYLPTPAEAIAADLAHRLAEGDVIEVSGPDHTTRRIVGRSSLGYDALDTVPLPLAVDLTPRPGGLDVVVQAGPWRGHSYNHGLLSNGLARGVTLRLERSDGAAHEHVLARGNVGHFAAVSPLRGRVDGLAGGRWHATLAWTDLSGEGRHPASLRRTFDEHPRRLALGEVLVPPALAVAGPGDGAL